MEILTTRLKLIPCTKETISTVSENYQLFDHVHFSLEEYEKDQSTLGWGVWFVQRLDTGETIGDIGFKGKPDPDGVVEVGYGIALNAHNKGYATEAVKALINWAFSTNKVTTIKAECLEDNFPSIKVLKKIGMKQTGKHDNMLFWELKK
ncbi:GNAT family N-acetyltransferase [Cytobacillus suaedae]|nr:GNAT family N-acetyltransferase [Cytobacillus suaedae]